MTPYDLEDDGVGKILDGLEKAGILDNTIIVFFSDHGANHLVRHKQMVTEGDCMFHLLCVDQLVLFRKINVEPI